MFLLVLKLLLRTRLSKAFLLFIVLLAFVDFALSFSGAFGEVPAQSLFGATFIIFIYMVTFTAVTLFGNGLGMTKPDQDFLLPSSIKGRTLNFALFTVQLISISLIFIILSFAYSIEVYHLTLLGALYIVNFLMLGVSLASLSVLVSDYGLLYRVPIFAAGSIFLFSFFFGFNYSPFAMAVGHIYSATLGTAVFFAALLLLGIRWLNTNDLYVRPPRIQIRKKETFKGRQSFVGLSPGKAIFRHFFTHFYSGRPIGMSGTVMAVSNRYRLKATIPIIVVASALLVGAILYIRPSSVTELYPILILFVIYLSFTLNIGLYSSTFSVERLWLSAMSMPFHLYVKRMVFAQVSQSLVLEMPIGVAMAVLGFIYGPSLFPILIAVLAISPESVAVLSSLSIISKPPQTWENAIMTRKVGLKRAIYLFPYAVIMLSGILLSIISPLYAAVEAASLAIAIYIFLGRKGYWEKMVSKLAENSYI